MKLCIIYVMYNIHRRSRGAESVPRGGLCRLRLCGYLLLHQFTHLPIVYNEHLIKFLALR